MRVKSLIVLLALVACLQQGCTYTPILMRPVQEGTFGEEDIRDGKRRAISYRDQSTVRVGMERNEYDGRLWLSVEVKSFNSGKIVFDPTDIKVKSSNPIHEYLKVFPPEEVVSKERKDDFWRALNAAQRGGTGVSLAPTIDALLLKANTLYNEQNIIGFVFCEYSKARRYEVIIPVGQDIHKLVFIPPR